LSLIVFNKNRLFWLKTIIGPTTEKYTVLRLNCLTDDILCDVAKSDTIETLRPKSAQGPPFYKHALPYPKTKNPSPGLSRFSSSYLVLSVLQFFGFLLVILIVSGVYSFTLKVPSSLRSKSSPYAQPHGTTIQH